MGRQPTGYTATTTSHLSSRSRADKKRFSLSYATLRKNLFGGRHFNFMRGDLERLLYSKIKDRVEVRLGTSVDSFEQDEAQME